MDWHDDDDHGDTMADMGCCALPGDADLSAGSWHIMACEQCIAGQCRLLTCLQAMQLKNMPSKGGVRHHGLHVTRHGQRQSVLAPVLCLVTPTSAWKSDVAPTRLLR